MSHVAAVALSLVVMVALIVGLDVLFLQHQLWLRLIVNVLIVAAFAALYFAVLRNIN